MPRVLFRVVAFLAFFASIGVLSYVGRNSRAAAPPPEQAKHGLTGNYYVGSPGYAKDTLPADVIEGRGFLQIWTDPNDFRLPRAFTPPAATRVDAQVAFGQGRGFHVDPNVDLPPSVVWWPTGYALPPGWAASCGKPAHSFSRSSGSAAFPPKKPGQKGLRR